MTHEIVESSLPRHECFVHRVSQLEGVVADSQVVLKSEWLQHNAVPYREGQAQVIAGVTLSQKTDLACFHHGNKVLLQCCEM